ncbi:MAG: tail fiber domain-containing protein, partial [bacterium]
ATGWRADTVGGGINGSGSPGQLAFWNSAAGLSGSNNLFWNNANLQLGIGVSPPTAAVDVIGTARLRGMPVGGQFQVVTDDAGLLFRGGSSRRYKTDIRHLEADFSTVLDLEPMRFKWKSTGREDIGLIAEDVDLKVKDLVIYDDQQRPDGVKYDRVALYLLSVVKDQQKQIKQLQEAVKSLQDKKSSSGD